LYDPEGAILPWGALLSLGSALFVVVAGWQGGKLVFEHQIGVMMTEEEAEDEEPGVRFPGPEEAPAP
ncbi:MAG: DUF2231 domain-containing protein, partial [Pseudomonadota bacterium]|nr:DUF2231 domain-containing protein [Pseudomonadota bacterium]